MLAIAGTHYAVKITTTDEAPSAQLDGRQLTRQQGEVRIPLDGKQHQLEVFIKPNTVDEK
jgi:cyclic beta-1,2-glucan synthetase